jgi:hypothetical protein
MDERDSLTEVCYFTSTCDAGLRAEPELSVVSACLSSSLGLEEMSVAGEIPTKRGGGRGFSFCPCGLFADTGRPLLRAGVPLRTAFDVDSNAELARDPACATGK